jgi:hypothetical protein
MGEASRGARLPAAREAKPPAASFSSSAGATSEGACSSRRSKPSRNGGTSSATRGSPRPCWTESSIHSHVLVIQGDSYQASRIEQVALNAWAGSAWWRTGAGAVRVAFDRPVVAARLVVWLRLSAGMSHVKRGAQRRISDGAPVGFPSRADAKAAGQSCRRNSAGVGVDRVRPGERVVRAAVTLGGPLRTRSASARPRAYSAPQRTPGLRRRCAVTTGEPRGLRHFAPARLGDPRVGCALRKGDRLAAAPRGDENAPSWCSLRQRRGYRRDTWPSSSICSRTSDRSGAPRRGPRGEPPFCCSYGLHTPVGHHEHIELAEQRH